MCLLQGCLLKGLSFIWVTDIGMSVIGVFYSSVDLGVSIIGDVYQKGVSIISGTSIKKDGLYLEVFIIWGVYLRGYL